MADERRDSREEHARHTRMLDALMFCLTWGVVALVLAGAVLFVVMMGGGDGPVPAPQAGQDVVQPDTAQDRGKGAR